MFLRHPAHYSEDGGAGLGKLGTQGLGKQAHDSDFFTKFKKPLVRDGRPAFSLEGAA